MTGAPLQKYVTGIALCGLMAGLACAQGHVSTVWSTYVGSDWDNDTVNAVAVDSATNSFLAGRLDSGGLYNNGGDGLLCSDYAKGFILKASPVGTLLWARDLNDVWGRVFYDTPCALSLSQTHLFTVGNTQGSPSDASTYALIAALDPADGNILWADKSIGNEGGTNSFNAVAVAPDGSNVYAVGHTTLSNQVCNVSGYTVGTTHYGTNLIGDLDAFVVKFDAEGNILWRHYLGGVNADSARAVAVGADGAVYVAGETRSPGWTSLASGSASPDNAAGFLVKLTADGNHVWSSLLNGSGHDRVRALRADPVTGSLFLGGITASVDFLANAPCLNSHAGGTDGFIVRVTDTNTAFRVDWCRFAGSTSADEIAALDLLHDGRLAVGGTTASGGWLTLALGSQAFQGGQDGFVAIYDATNGAPSWATYTGGVNADKITALARAPQAFIIGGLTFSPNWVGGGFWDEWTKMDFSEPPEPDYTLSFGFAALWQPGAPLAPTFTAEPVDCTVQEGMPVTFSAVATGTAPLFYRWQRNGVPIPGATASNYTFTAAYDDNDAAYTCTASNLVGTATSRAALLTVIPMGTLTVSLSPTDAVARGARWRIDGTSTWLSSEASTNLPAGSYSIDFKPLTGWRTPAPLTDVQISHADSLSLQAAYTPILPEADRTISGTNVTLAVRAPVGLVNWTLAESLPPGLTPFAITGGGEWNSSARTLTFSGAEATTNMFTYSVTCATSGLYTVTGALAASNVSDTVSVAGDTEILSAKVIRTVEGQTVTLTMLEPTTRKSWYVNEDLPATLTATVTAGPGDYIPDDSMIYWGTYGTGQTLAYEVSGGPGMYELSGIVSIAGVVEPIFGDSVLVIPGADIPPPDILAFVPAAPGFFALTFTSVVDQTYAVLTNAAPGTNGWAACVAPVTGADGTTQVQVPAAPPRLFFRVRALPE